MTTFEKIRDTLHEQLPKLRREFGVESLGVFGSYVRKEQRPESDVDLLVRFAEPIGLIRFMSLEHRLRDLLGVDVDLVMESALKPTIGTRVLDEVRYV